VSNAVIPNWSIRSFRPEDSRACRQLFSEGLLGGALAKNDTALDIDDINANYMNRPGNHFWVAVTAADQVIGMVGVQHYDEGSGEIRRLRLHKDYRNQGISRRLVEAALRYCLEHQYLKITLDTYLERGHAVPLFEKYRYRLDRAKMVGERELLYFYYDLYTGMPKPHKEDGDAGSGKAK